MIETSKEEEKTQRLFLFQALSLDDNDNEDATAAADDNDNDEQQWVQPSEEEEDQIAADEKDIKDGDQQELKQKQYRDYTAIAGISQLETWDCGVACLLMIARWLREENECDDNDGGDSNDKSAALPNKYKRYNNDKGNINNAINNDARMLSEERLKILSEVGTKSIWTSDLMWQLQAWKMKTKKKRSAINESSLTLKPTATIPVVSFDDDDDFVEYNFDFVLASQQLMDADETYRDFQYYQNAFEEDQSRVARTFRELHRQRVPMIQTQTQKSGLSLSTVIEIIRRNDCLAIVLLDYRVLLAKSNTLSPSLSSSSPSSPSPSPSPLMTNNSDVSGGQDDSNQEYYAGHYIILCGISNDSRHVEIANLDNDIQYFHSCPPVTRAAVPPPFAEKVNNRQEEEENTFCFVLRNPDQSSTSSPLSSLGCMFVTPTRFEASWRAAGTDEDIIFIRKRQRQRSQNQNQNRRYGHISEIKAVPQHQEQGSIRQFNQCDGDARRLSVRVKTLVRENYFALTKLLWTLYKQHCPSFFWN